MNGLSLTVYFDGQFWCGLFERFDGNNLSVCKVVFGAEPKDAEVFNFFLRQYKSLKFSPQVKTEVKSTAVNPKRRLREAKKRMQTFGVGTKSRQALSAMREVLKKERVAKSKEEREAEERRKYELRRKKQKEKHKGK